MQHAAGHGRRGRSMQSPYRRSRLLRRWTGGSCILVLYRKDGAAPLAAACTLSACGGLQRSFCCASSGQCCPRRLLSRSPLRSNYFLFVAALMALIRVSWVMPAHPRCRAGFRQPACPFGQSLHAITSVTISADFTSRANFGLAAANMSGSGLRMLWPPACCAAPLPADHLRPSPSSSDHRRPTPGISLVFHEM